MNPFQMSLDHQIHVMIEKTQMSGDSGGSQCGLTSLLPMSCRGRAAAFARDLHTRLRNLGTGHDDDESSWLARDTTQRVNSTPPRDNDTFYDFELECESPSSPIDDYDVPFTEQSPTDNSEPPFYDGDTESDFREPSKLKQQHNNKLRTNGFTFSTAFYNDTSPVKLQPAPRENGHVDKRLYSAITFEDCARQNSVDEIDSFVNSSSFTDQIHLPVSNLDSDSEFESAKSDPSDEVLDISKKVEHDITEVGETLSICEEDIPVAEECKEVEIKESLKIETVIEENNNDNHLEIITTEVPNEKELSPEPQIEETLLKVDSTESEPDQDGEDDRPQRVRRCSSLKTGKTPPGTPGRKKIVRFADVLGLDLADVKTFLDEIPVIPKSAYDDLTGCDIVQNSPPALPKMLFGSLTLVPLFQLPKDFTNKLEKFNVCLETARVGEGAHITVCGSVRVRNLDFHKTVHIRYTMDRWKTYTDLQATYVPGSCDGFSDRFQFVLYAPCIAAGQRLEIAVRFQCKGQQFWDNNCGANYCFDCLTLGASVISPSANGPLHPTVDWHPSFY